MYDLGISFSEINPTCFIGLIQNNLNKMQFCGEQLNRKKKKQQQQQCSYIGFVIIISSAIFTNNFKIF